MSLLHKMALARFTGCYSCLVSPSFYNIAKVAFIRQGVPAVPR